MPLALGLGPGVDRFPSLIFYGQSTPAGAVLGGEKAGLAIDFTQDSALVRWPGGTQYSGNVAGLISNSRASSATRFNSAGLLVTDGNNTVRLDYDPLTLQQVGLLVEDTRTNVALWNRDLTNAAWTKSNVTAALNQTGIDGAANAASSITATAGNGTCLQAVTLGSSARFQTAYVKRITGTGTVNMTTDGGTTWTAITVTAGWTRVSVPTQTLANPSLGFQLMTNGDAIAVDYVQNENGAGPTSAILTTSSAATRATELCSVPIGSLPFNDLAGTMFADGLSTHSLPSFVSFADAGGSTANSINVFRNGTPTWTFRAQIAAAIQWNFGAGGNTVLNVRDKFAVAWAANDQMASWNGLLGSNPAAASIPTVALGLKLMTFGGLSGFGFAADGWVKRAAYWPRRRPNADLQRLSA